MGATHAPDTTRWKAIIRIPVAFGTLYAGFHAAIIDPSRVCLVRADRLR